MRNGNGGTIKRAGIRALLNAIPGDDTGYFAGRLRYYLRRKYGRKVPASIEARMEAAIAHGQAFIAESRGLLARS